MQRAYLPLTEGCDHRSSKRFTYQNNYYQTRYVYKNILAMWMVAEYNPLPMENIKATIRTLTAHTGLSQADVARLLGVPVKTLNAWLSGRVTCRHKQMLSLALEALGKRLEVRR